MRQKISKQENGCKKIKTIENKLGYVFIIYFILISTFQNFSGELHIFINICCVYILIPLSKKKVPLRSFAMTISFHNISRFTNSRSSSTIFPTHSVNHHAIMLLYCLSLYIVPFYRRHRRQQSGSQSVMKND